MASNQIKNFKNSIEQVKYKEYILFFKQHLLLLDAGERLESYNSMVSKTVEFLRF